MTEKVGLQAVWDNADYNKGLDEYLKGIDRANQATKDASGSISGMGTAAAGVAVSGLGPLGIAAGVVGAQIISGVVSAAQDAIAWLFELGQQALSTAGRFQELTVAAIAIGQTMGIAQTDIEAQIASIKDVGIRTDVAAQAVAQFTRYQLDLSKATQLATVAQDAAVLSGRDSSDTLDRLIYAVTTLNPRIARTAGIMVNFGNEFDRVAASTGRVAADLTETEKATIALDAVLQQGTRIAGTYTAAMGTASKQMRSLSGRIIPELFGALGAPFQEALYTIVKGFSNLIEALTRAVSEGGSLYPILINLGAAASIIADGFSAAIDVIVDFVDGFQVEFNEGMAATVEDALSWGVEIVVALADGLIQGAVGALSAAMNVIGGLLEGWLAPGSPPKVAPGLLAWAKAAGTEYLRGFTLADFSVLEDLQGTLKKVLEGPEFAALSKELIAGIGGGGLDDAFFAKIADATGEFGNEIAKLAKDQFLLAEATEEAVAAQDALNKSQEDAVAAQSKVSSLIREYNAELRAGADPAALRGRLAQIQAAERERDAAYENARAAEAAAKASEEQVKPLAEQAKLQDLLVQQLLDLAQAEGKRGKGGRRGVARVGKVAEPKAAITPEDFMPSGEAISGRITDAISRAVETAKKALLDKLGEIFKPLTDKWTNEWKPMLDKLIVQLTGFGGTVSEWVNNTLLPALGKVDQFFRTVFGAMGEVLTKQTGPMIQQAITGLIGIFDSLNINWTTVADAITAVVTTLAVMFGAQIALIVGVVTGLVNAVASGVANIVSAFNDIIAAVQTMAQGVQLILSGDLVPGVGMIIEGLVGMQIAQFKLVFGTILEMVGGFVEGFLSFFSELANKLIGQSIIPDMIKDILDALGGMISKLMEIGTEMVKGLQKAFIDQFNIFKSNVADKIREFIDWIKTLLGIASKSKVMFGIGVNAGLGFLAGWDAIVAQGLTVPQMAPVMATPASTNTRPVAGAGGTTKVVNVNIGDVRISDAAEGAMFQARVEQAVRRALGG